MSKYYTFFKFILLSCIFAKFSFANIIDIPSPQYPTIQAGINSAVAGDTVLVQPGEYFENLIIEKGNIVVGSLFITTGDTLYKYITIVNGDTSGSVITINTNQEQLTLSGLTIKNGKASQGGGILCLKSNPTLRHLNIIENEANYGGGIHIKSDYSGGPITIFPRIEHVWISNNISSYDGGGIYCDMMTAPSMDDVKISNNQTTRNGGGIFCNFSGLPQLINCKITGNIAGEKGGGVYFTQSFVAEEATILSSIINKNIASSGGGIFCDYFAKPTISNSEINENSGGGVFCWEYTRLKLNNCKILRNIGNGASCSGDGSGFNMNSVLISENSGAGISLGYYGSVGLSNVTIKKNTGTGIYFGIYSIASFDSTNRCNIYHNNFGIGPGSDLQSSQSRSIQVIVDTFTVLIPTSRQASPLSVFSFDILHKADIHYDHYYISPNGDNSNSGLNSDQPRKNIYYQLSTIPEDNFISKIIHLAEGIYSNSSNGEIFPLYSRPNVTISGISKESVIIDAEGIDRVFYVYKNDFSLQNMTITGGYTTEAGGGICQKEYSVILENLIITGNHADIGGGIYTDRSISYKDVDIFQNTATRGGGIFFDEHATAKFDSIDRCNIFSNEGEIQGIDLYGWGQRNPGIFKVYLDVFTVKNPDVKYVYPTHYFTMDIKSGTNDSIYYISPNGSDMNSGISPDHPLKTLSHTMSLIPDDNEINKVISMANGKYSPSTNGEIFPINLKPNISLTGTSKKSVVLDAENTAAVLNIETDNVSLKNLTITGGNSVMAGGGIRCTGDEVNLESLIIKQNYAWIGGGIYCDGDINLISTRISDNSAKIAGGIYFDENANAFFDQLNRCSIYANEGESFGIDLFASEDRNSGIITVYLDTFTVLIPEEKYVYPLHYFSIDISGTDYKEVETSLLYPSYPNPFMTYTTLRFQLASTEKVKIDIYDIQGRVVKSYFKEQVFDPGEYTLMWYGDNELNQQVASGIYICRFKAGEKIEFQKMVYIK